MNILKNVSRKNRLAYVLITVTMVLSGALITISAVMGEDYDSRTLCDRQNPPKAHAVVLIDATDVLSPPRVNVIHNAILALEKGLADHDRLSVMVVDADGQTGKAVKQLFSMCKPPDGSHMNPVYQAPEKAARRYQKDFYQPLVAAIDLLHSFEDSNSSPILEALYELNNVPDNKIPVTRLVLVSDLLQKSTVLDFYHDTPDFSQFRKTGTYLIAQHYLSGAEVVVWQINRPKYRRYQTDAVEQFWGEYFTETGVAEYSVKKF